MASFEGTVWLGLGLGGKEVRLKVHDVGQKAEFQ